MAMDFYSPTDFIPDEGWNGRTYPIEDPPCDTEIIYDKAVQNISTLQGSVVGMFTEWITAFFPPDYFKFVRIKTQSTFTAFKSFMKDIYKKEKPFMVIDPRPPEIVEDFLFAQNMLNRFNMIDPLHDNIGAKMIYAIPVMCSDLFELHYRRNRWRMEFDVMIMEESMNRMMNVHNTMAMNIRHNSKFDLIRNVPVMLPRRHIINIANFYGKDWKSEEFVEFLNSISRFPIIKRFTGNGKPYFYMEYELHIHVDVPSFPAKDSPEMSDAIEIGARVTDQFIFTVDLPSEFLFLTKREFVGRFDKGIQEDPNAVTFISPIYADLPWPRELNGYTLTNRVDIELTEGDDPKMEIISLIKDYDADIYRTIMEFIHHQGDLSELIICRVYPNGSMKDIGTVLHNDGVLELVAPKMNKLYTANIYLNLKNINLIREGKNKKFVGDIQKY